MAATKRNEKISERQEAVAALLDPHKKDVIDAVVRMAKLADPAATAIFFRYLAPAPVAPEKTVVLPGLENAQTLVQKVESVLNAVARGEIGPTVGEQLMRSLAVLSNAVALSEFADRIAALERSAQARGGALPTAQRVPDEPPALA
jgi:hypothetical protein